jgi:ribonuclease HI
MESSIYLGFANKGNHHTQNLASTAWVLYSPECLLVSSGGIFLGPSMNNVVKYSIIIELLRDAISHGILSLEVHLDSQLVVCQLNGSYHVLRQFLRIRILEQQFDFVNYHHIPRSSNYVSDAYDKKYLDWHLSYN